MTTQNEIIADLKKAEGAFNREIGKRTFTDAFDILLDLDLGLDAELLTLNIIEEAFEKDAFAGYLRYDGIVSRLQITALRLQKAELAVR
jgi:hypothetical protein